MRQKNIDVMKGVGILLVMLYHSASRFPVDLTVDPIVDSLGHIIDSFFMQLFFFCSGYLIVKKDNLYICDRFLVKSQIVTSNEIKPSSLGGVIYKRFRRLLIPYFCFAFINVCLRALFSSSTRSGTDFYDGIINLIFYAKYYWFLFVLFVIDIGFRIVIKHFSNVIVWGVIGIVLSLFSFFYPIDIFHIDRICEYFLYVVLGAFVFLIENRNNTNHKIFDNYYILIVSGILYVLFFQSTKYDYSFIWTFGVLAAASAVLFNYSLSFKLSDYSLICKYLCFFGNYSLQYYLIHILILLPVYYLVRYLPLPSPIFYEIAIFLIIIFVSSVILFILKKVPRINFILGL